MKKQLHTPPEKLLKLLLTSGLALMSIFIIGNAWMRKADAQTAELLLPDQ